MQFQKPTHLAIVIKRYKRFLVDVRLVDTGETLTAHLANTGSMRSCWEPGQQCLLTYHSNPKRKLKYSVEMIHNGETWINVNTASANGIVKEALHEKKIPKLRNFDEIIPEFRLPDSRIDFKLSSTLLKKDYFLEVKNVTLKEQGFALFPDAVTKRGQKHLLELIKLKQQGYGAGLFFLISRNDVNLFKPASHIDSLYASHLDKANKNGVDIFCYSCHLDQKQRSLTSKIPYELH